MVTGNYEHCASWTWGLHDAPELLPTTEPLVPRWAIRSHSTVHSSRFLRRRLSLNSPAWPPPVLRDVLACHSIAVLRCGRTGASACRADTLPVCGNSSARHGFCSSHRTILAFLSDSLTKLKQYLLSDLASGCLSELWLKGTSVAPWVAGSLKCRAFIQSAYAAKGAQRVRPCPL